MANDSRKPALANSRKPALANSRKPALANSRKPALANAIDTNLAETLVRPLEKQPDLTPEVDEELQNISDVHKSTADSAKAASEIELSPEPELIENLKAQYPAMKSSLEEREMSTEGIPTWEQVQNGLTPEVLNKALKLPEVSLLLIPPTTWQSKVRAIDSNPVLIQEKNTYIYKLDANDKNLWNGGKTESETRWRVGIAEGIQNVKQDPEIYDGKRDNYEMTKMWVAKLEAQGLDVMNDANAHLTLVMKALSEGKPIDTNTYTVLNGRNLTKDALVAFSRWIYGGVSFVSSNSAGSNHRLRLRGLVWVDVPQT